MDIAKERVPIFNVPGIVIVFITVSVLMHVYRLQLSPVDEFSLAALYGFVPARLALAMEWTSVEQITQAFTTLPAAERPSVAFLSTLLSDDANVWTSLVSYAFIHANWPHVLLNSLWFLAFGSVVARRLGAFVFTIFFGLSAAGAALCYAAFNSGSIVPVIGASGAVAAAMGAAMLLPMRPMASPKEQAELAHVPLMPLSVAATDRRVVANTVLWIGINLLFAFGFNIGGGATEAANIAWEAHVGGYFIGIFLMTILDRFCARPIA